MLRTAALRRPRLLVPSLAGRLPVQTKEVTTSRGTPSSRGSWRGTRRQDKRPGVIVVHEWWGHNEHARHQAMRLAEAGYVAWRSTCTARVRPPPIRRRPRPS